MLTRPTPNQPIRTLGDRPRLPDVPGFTRVGAALDRALEDTPLGRALAALEAASKEAAE